MYWFDLKAPLYRTMQIIQSSQTSVIPLDRIKMLAQCNAHTQQQYFWYNNNNKIPNAHFNPLKVLPQKNIIQ